MNVPGQLLVGRPSQSIEGQLKVSELSLDTRVEDANTVVKEGEEIEVKITAVDRKKRTIAVSVRAKESEEESAAVRDYGQDTGTGAKLGDLLKEHLDNG